MTTIEAYLDNDGNVTPTADQLFTHRHTVRYRLERVKELCGHDITSTEGREKLGLGLKAMRVLGIAPPRGPALEPGTEAGRAKVRRKARRLGTAPSGERDGCEPIDRARSTVGEATSPSASQALDHWSGARERASEPESLGRPGPTRARRLTRARIALGGRGCSLPIPSRLRRWQGIDCGPTGIRQLRDEAVRLI